MVLFSRTINSIIMPVSETLLTVKDLHVHYGGVKALDGVSLGIDEGEVVALMGRTARENRRS